MTTEFALGHYWMIADDGSVPLRIQNFFIGDTVTYDGYSHMFSPFGFSGSTSRQGDMEPGP